MSKNIHEVRYRTYWLTWLALLGLTATMIWADLGSLPRLTLVLLLAIAMLAKASLIGGNFMHLRFENVRLVLIVAVGILATAAILFLLLAVDGMRIFALGKH